MKMVEFVLMHVLDSELVVYRFILIVCPFHWQKCVSESNFIYTNIVCLFCSSCNVQSNCQNYRKEQTSILCIVFKGVVFPGHAILQKFFAVGSLLIGRLLVSQTTFGNLLFLLRFLLLLLFSFFLSVDHELVYGRSRELLVRISLNLVEL